MGFRQADSEGRGGFARIWKIIDCTNGATIKLANGETKEIAPGNYSLAKISTRKKCRNGDGYETDFQDGFVRLIGTAHKKGKTLTVTEKGVAIQITSCEVTISYNAETEKSYTNYAIFAFNVPDDNNSSFATKGNKKNGAKVSKAKTTKVTDVEDDVDDELPF